MILVIDTEKYAGNFERQLTAYCTGSVGECSVGDEEAKKFNEEVGEPLEFITSAPDEHGCWRPCKLWATPGWFNDGNGKHYKGEGKYHAYLSVAILIEREPTDEELSLIKERALKYGKKHRIKITGFRLITEKTTYIEKHI